MKTGKELEGDEEKRTKRREKRGIVRMPIVSATLAAVKTEVGNDNFMLSEDVCLFFS